VIPEPVARWIVVLLPVVVTIGAGLWAALLAFAEEAAVDQALHTLGDAPPADAASRVPLHRALHLARLALLVLAAVAAGSALEAWERPLVEGLFLLGVTTVFLFVVVDGLPRSAAALAPELADTVLPFARRTLAPFRPLLWVLAWADRSLHRLVAVPQVQPPTMGGTQRDMLLGVFTLADATVDEAMTPRLDMAAVDVAWSTEQMLEAVRHHEHTRLPVYDGTPDNIVGVIFTKDLVPLATGLADQGTRWQDLVRPALFVPETKTLDSLLRDFQRGPAHLAVVVDEFGGTAGLITLEDVLEEIVGEIRDERDTTEPPSIRRDGPRYWVDGRVSLDDLSAALDSAITHPEVSTVGGLIYSVLGRVPRAGDELTLDGFRVVVERVDRRRVTRVLFERLGAGGGAGAGREGGAA
jgi:CBS domain containing-hemolysin-like protein